jgi:15-cis-phytoene synthase
MIDPKDLAHCEAAIRHGSLSFHAASRLLPSVVRDPALALYAFCRVADDEVDLTHDKAAALERLRERLELAYAGRPENAPPDRAFAALIEHYNMPRALPEALLEGLEWDVSYRRYNTLSDVISYSARVASSVGVMMCVLMGVRDRSALARACDLGVAMQLTNIARDVGEDALEGRLYLPLDWLEKSGLSAEALMEDPRPSKVVRYMVRNLLIEAERLYRRSEAGIAVLPLRCRPGIYAARYIYAGIGDQLQQMGYDPVTRRARTTKVQKLGLLGLSVMRSGASSVLPVSPMIYAAPLPEVAFLIDAAAEAPRPHWSDAVTATLSRLAVEDRVRVAQAVEARGRLRITQ